MRVKVWEAVFEPFGKPFEVVKTKGLRLRFPGQWAIGGTGGLSYNWHRFYDPKTGRYTRPDPLGFVDGPSVYAYVGGNPMGFVDPEGQNRKKILKKFANYLFRPGSFLNRGRYCRVGYGTKKGRKVFRAAGEWVKKFNEFRGRPDLGNKIDFFDMGRKQ